MSEDRDTGTPPQAGTRARDKRTAEYELETPAAHRFKKFEDSFPGEHLEKPWENEELLRTLYIDEQLSMNQIRIGWGCSQSTVSKWVDKHGIEKRTQREALELAYGVTNQVSFHTDKRGREIWSSGDFTIVVHRLIAVAEYGVDAVAEHHVHHISGIPWDNRPENLMLVTNEEHGTHHRKVDGLDRLRVAELYENGDTSYRKLHDALDYDQVTWHTLMDIHKEFYSSEDDDPDPSDDGDQATLGEYA